MVDLKEVDEFLPKVRSFVATKVPLDDVDDIANEVLLGIAMNLQNCSSKDKVMSYIFAIARNKIADYYRKTYKDKKLLVSLKSKIKSDLSMLGEEASNTLKRNDFTKAELQVFKMIGSGKSNADIAKELFISGNTVRTHIKHIYRKLGSSNRAEVAIISNSYLKVMYRQAAWLDKFFRAYICFGKKNGYLTDGILDEATKVFGDIKSRLV